MKLSTIQVLGHAAPRLRNLFHLVGSPRVALAVIREERTEIESTQHDKRGFHQLRIESEAERHFEFDRYRYRAQTRTAQLNASTKFYYDEDGTPRFATPAACLNGEVSFEKAMTFQEWLALRRATR